MSLSRELLTQLAAAGLVITPHVTYQNAWFFSTATDGHVDTIGPYTSADGTLVAGVAWLVGVASDARTDRDALLFEVQRLRAMLDAS